MMQTYPFNDILLPDYLGRKNILRESVESHVVHQQNLFKNRFFDC